MTDAKSHPAVMDLPRRDARDKITGHTRYTIDSAYRGSLHGFILRAEIASARIVRLDTSAALKMPGVRAIITADDAPGRHGAGVADRVLFASEVVRHYGEPLAAVAADTLDQAKAAAKAIVFEYETMPAVLTLQEALADGAPLVHPDWKDYELARSGAARGGNIAWEATVSRGDVDAAFARPDVTIVESTFRVGRQNQVCFEPRTAVAIFDDHRYHVTTSTQNPWAIRNTTAKALGVSEGAVRVTAPPAGGGFGLKYESSVEPMAAALARKARRPVIMVNSRQDEMLFSHCRENAEIRIRSAITAEGEIVGREATLLMDCGAYGGEQIFLTTMTAHTLGGNYRLGSARLSSRAVYTNTVANGAFRACNGVYNTFALERHTDEICKAIGMSPLEFRYRNAIGDGDLGSTGQVFEGDVLKPMLKKMEGLRPTIDLASKLDDGRLFGRATTIGTWFVFVGPSSATVNMNVDGSATLVTTGVEIGSGTMVQSLPQIVAARLGLRPDDVIVKGADTDAAGYDMGIGGGRATVSIGSASTAACNEVREKLLRAAAELLQSRVGDLVLANGRVEISGAKGAGIAIVDVVKHIEKTIGPVSGTGAFTKPGVAAMAGCAAGHFLDAIDIPVFAVHECDVAVDPETGHVEVLAYRVVQDVGRALNPRAIRGQIQGGVVQGFGYALHEEMTIGADGKIQQAGFESYRLPLASDVVPIEVVLHEGAPSIGPLGTKGAGEVPILNVGASVACAVANAIGKPIYELPLTPPRVLNLILNDHSMPELDHISRHWNENTLGMTRK